MKRPAPKSTLQNEVTKLFSIIRDQGRTSPYTAVPALLILGRFASNFPSEAYANKSFYDFFLAPNAYRINNEILGSSLAWLGTQMLDLDADTRHRLVSSVESLHLPALTQAEFESMVDFALDQLNRYIRGWEQFTIPNELAEVITSVYDPKPGSCVYNLQAGTATLVPFLDPAVTYVGQEENSEILKLAALRLIAYQRSSSTLVSGTANEQWLQLSTADLILVTQPVFGGHSHTSQLSVGLPTKMPADVALVHTILRHMQPGSQAVIPVFYGFLFQQSKAHRQVRQELVVSGALEAIIEFPAGILPQTSVRIALLLLNKACPAGRPVLLLDADSYTQRKGRQVHLHTAALLNALAQPAGANGAHFVTEAEFDQHEYDFTYRRYLLPAGPGLNQVRFERIVSPIRLRGAQPTEGRLIRIRDLKSDTLNFTLTSDELPVDQFSGRRLASLKHDALLLALQGGRLKPTWYIHKPGEEVFLSLSSILPLQVKEDQVELDYLVAELNSEFVQQQLRNLNIGSAMPAVRKSDLWQLVINLPGRAEQQNLVRIASEQAIKTKQVASSAAQVEQTLKADAYAQLAALKHALGRPQLNLTSNVELLEAAIQQAAAAHQVLAPHSPLFPTETTTVQDTIAAIKRDLEFMFQTLNRSEAELVPEDYPLEDIDILAFLREKVLHIQAGLPPFSIALNESFMPVFDFLRKDNEPRVAQRIDSVAVQANKYLLKLLFNHIIDNAQRHGFNNLLKERNRIAITTEEVFLDENFSEFAVGITIANNGHSFPLNFDVAQLTRKGAKAGLTGNTGIGGYEVKQIVNYFGGKLEIISSPATEYTVAYQLELPVVDVQYKAVKS